MVVFINRVRKGTEAAIGKEQCGFRRGWRCVDQIFVAQQLCEKFLTTGREVYFAFMNLTWKNHIIGWTDGLCGQW